MIAFLMGELADVQAGDRSSVTLNVGGVGYRATVPQRVAREIGSIGESVQLFTHLVVRDTEMLLYGFGSAAERELFVELIKVSGVGPSLAIALLGTLTLTELVQAVVTENVRILSLTPGVGKKTAQRLVLELKSRLAEWRTTGDDVPVAAGGPPSSIYSEVEIALLALGYSSAETVRALQAIGQQEGDRLGQSVEDWLRSAIAYLSQQE
ncbi:MAG: Holliday junction branch migration protein RuvA [Cyanobacteria bacterium P01_E01_bin.45]